MKEVQELEKAYDKCAHEYFITRIEGKNKSGIWNREVEQPNMFKLVPKNLKGKRLLDIACGVGIHMKEYVKRGADAIGIDISKEMLKLAKQHFPKGTFKIGNAYKLKFKNESFDIITASFIYDHVRDINKSFKEVKRVLKREGLFILSVPHPIRDMFRDDDEKKYIPSHSYFDKNKYYTNMAKTEKIFPIYPRILQDYFDFFLKNGFILKEFLEKGVDKSIKRKYFNLKGFYFKIPLVVFFKWQKL